MTVFQGTGALKIKIFFADDFPFCSRFRSVENEEFILFQEKIQDIFQRLLKAVNAKSNNDSIADEIYHFQKVG